MSGPYDILIKNARIVDGTGAPAYSGSVGIIGERIAEVGDLGDDARRVIDARGRVVCPGFVDAHSHADTTLLDHPEAANLVMQGITTFVGGNCGFTMAPIRDDRYVKGLIVAGSKVTSALSWRTFGEWLSRVEEARPSLNYVPLVGHNTVRGALMGEDFKRKATSEEVEQMKGLVTEAMESGAFGISVGLDAYWPGHFAGVDELVALARVAGEHGGYFTPHTRHHQNQWPADDASEYGYGIFHAPKGEIIAGRYHGLLEAVEIARAAGVQLHIAHLTPAYIVPQPHPAFLDDALAKATLVDIIDKPRDEGMDVTFNMLGWDQSIGAQESLLGQFFSYRLALPEWLRGLDKAGFVARLSDRRFRDQLKSFIYSGKFKFGMLHPITDPYWMDCYRILRTANGAYQGRTVGEIARERQPDHIIDAVYDESLEVVFDLLVEDPETTWALIIDKREYGALPEFLRHEAGMPITDVNAFPAEPEELTGIPPIAYGMVPHYLRLYVKEMGVLGLEEAIKKITSVPARDVLHLTDRGVLEAGAYADVVVMDFDAIREGGDFLNPAEPPEGIDVVLVNGQVVCEDAGLSGARPGKVLHRS